MTWRSRSLLAAIVLLVAACGGGDDDTDSSGASADSTDEATVAADEDDDEGAATASGGASCSVEVTGDVEFTADDPGLVPAVSDYWMSDEALQQAKQVHDDYDARVARGQQLLQIFQTNCGNPEGVLLMTTDETTRADVPQAPGAYTVLNYLDKAKPGISAAVVVPGDDLFGVTGGDVEITRFDDGVAGTFELQAEEISISVDQGESPKHITITGTFDVP